jgi:hypothetical protein
MGSIGKFFAYGGRADGEPHPLSSITTLNGRATAGWSLAQWQAHFAFAKDGAGNNPVTDLSNEIDEVALQAAINTAVDYATYQQTVRLPPGTIRLTRPIRTGCVPLNVVGAQGTTATTLRQTVRGQDGWHHGTSDTACPASYGAKFSMQHVQFKAQNFGGTAIKIIQNTGTAGMSMRDVTVLAGSFASKEYWRNGIHCEGCSLSNFDNVSLGGIISGENSAAGIGLYLGGARAVGFNWRGGYINGWRTCVESTTGSEKDGQGDIEGISFDGLNADSCQTIFRTRYVDGGVHPTPQYFLKNSQIGKIGRQLFDMNVSAEVFIENNLTYPASPFLIGGGNAVAGSRTLSNRTGDIPSVGMYVGSPFNILPVGTRITAVSGTTLTLSQPANATATAVSISYQPVATPSAAVTAGSNTVRLSAITPLMQVDSPVAGPGIPAGTTITDLDGDAMTATLSRPATATRASAELTVQAPPALPFIRIARSQRFIIRGNSFQFGGNANVSSIVSIIGSSHGRIESNFVSDFGNVINAFIVDEGQNDLIFDSKNLFGQWNNTGGSQYVVNPKLCGTCRWEAYYSSVGAALLSDGKVQVSGSAVGTVRSGAPSGEVLVTLPANPFLPGQTPIMVVGNGDMAANPHACGAQSGSWDPKAGSFRAMCPGAAAGSNLRLDYILTGR